MANSIFRFDTPLDFFVWDFYKTRVYYTEVDSIEELTRRIQKTTQELQQVMITRAIRTEVRRRTRECVRQNGRHFEQILN